MAAKDSKERQSAQQNDGDAPVEAASARISGNDQDVRDSADFETGEVVEAVNDPESTVNKPTSLLDKEARMRAELNEEPASLEDRPQVNAPYAVEGNDTSAYVGVNPEYMTYASETERPLRAGEGSAEAYFEDQLLSPKAFAVAAAPESNQTEGGGSSVPLVYPEVSGEGYVNEPIKVTDAPVGDEVVEDKAPTQTRDGATPSTKVSSDEF